MLSNLMDFNPLDILAAAALGEKDASSKVTTSAPGHASTTGQSEDSEPTDSKDADGLHQEMGKTTVNSLNCNCSAADTEPMSPQKMQWGSDMLIPVHLDKVDGKLLQFAISDLVQDITRKSLGKEVQSVVDSNALDLKKQFGDEASILAEGKGDSRVLELEKKVVSTDAVDSNCVLQVSQLESGNCELGVSSQVIEHKVTSGCVEAANIDVSNGDSPDPAETETDSTFSICHDHSYALPAGRIRLPVTYDDDDDIDVCSNSSPLSESSEQRSHNLSLDCNYLKYGILEGVSASTLDFNKCPRSADSPFKLPYSSSTPSPSADLIFKPSYSNGREETGIGSPSSSPSYPNSGSSPSKLVQKCGKFKIGTFASFSSSNLELEKFLKNKGRAGSKKLTLGILPDNRLNSQSISQSAHPMLPSPSMDWDRSEADSETPDDSSESRTPLRMSPDFTERVTEWSHPLFHDHDYCSKETGSVSDLSSLTQAKRKYTKRKVKLDGVNHEKILNAKYLKKELLRKDNVLKSPVTTLQEHRITDAAIMKTNPVGRPRKRPAEKVFEEEIDVDTGTKLKITGKFQDQYVYYLSKTSRTTTRRRQTPMASFSADKIIVPVPKPGDIVVPHLTDADIETVRLKGRGALNLPDRPHMVSHRHPVQSAMQSCHTSSEFISDVDSHIVSTILSMENDSLGSSSTSHVPDAHLASNQSDLTESLRLMSGDSSITSENVLNYLLSVVKEDSLLSSVSGFDACSSSMFQSLHADSIYTKADHGAESHQDPSLDTSPGSYLNSGHDLLDMSSKACQNQSSYLHHTALGSSHKHGPENFGHPVHKDTLDDNASLSDDLSSFISNSQGTSSSSSNTTQDGDSHGSLKSMFGSDLSSLGTPQQIASSVPRLTSIEKTLDYLGVREEDIKLDGGVFGSKLDQDDSVQALTPVSSTSTDDTPWIVTVTLYFNDVPAIMINNQPYIRLVDIHKQILPAKDTGILKKRCQLLKIPVLNCTEMQRYFLVQYGRAYNSKSTLIVSKEQATMLVTYYAMPQSRIARLDEAYQQRAGRRGGSEGSTSSQVNEQPQVKSSKKRLKSSKKASPAGWSESEPTERRTNQASQKVASQLSETATSSHSKRTRHKKVNYRDMLKGDEKEKSSQSAVLETIESVARSAPNSILERKLKKHSGKKKNKADLPASKLQKSDVSKKKLSKLEKKKLEKGSKIKKKSLQEKTKTGRKSHIAIKPDVEKEVAPSSEVDSEDDTTDSAQNKKFHPLKLRVNSLLNFAKQKKASPSVSKKGLFSCSGGATSPTSDMPVRILAVAHQAALTATQAESHLPAQSANIHLDMFTHSNSACVCCKTCGQFFSVPHFMRHHHVPIDNEWLATEAAHRILVPQNRENIPEQEKTLWEEFHRMQEAVGGFPEAYDETDSDDEESDYSDEEYQVSSKMSDVSVDSECSDDSSSEEEDGPCASKANGDTSSMTQSYGTNYSVSHGQDVFRAASSSSSSVSHSAMAGFCNQSNSISYTVESGSSAAAGNLRASCRKRKSKQLFSIEKYHVSQRPLLDENSNSHKVSDT